MSFEAFIADPWAQLHRSYRDAAFNIRPAPEFSTAEVIVASLYRACGYEGYSENEVTKAGREFDKTTRPQRRSRDEPGRVKLETWRAIVHGVLESPKQPNQSAKRFLQMCPLVPEVALYSGSARLVGNSWNPGALVQRMIQMGARNGDHATEVWGKLHEALSVGEADDIWARWLREEFHRRKSTAQAWKPTSIDQAGAIPDADRRSVTFPAQQFVRDVEAVIAAKTKMTRRQWVSILEAILRLGCTMHMIWLCDLNDKVWRAAQQVLAGNAAVLSIEEVRTQLVTAERRYLSYGNAAVADIKQYVSNYLVARLGINALLWGLPGSHDKSGYFDSTSGLHEFLKAIAFARKELASRKVVQVFRELTETHARTIACKKGIGSNMVEFARHTLGQRLTLDETLRGYDQGYLLRKKGVAKSAPWTVSFGPVAVLALVQSCLKESAGPRSIKTLCNHLGAYGIETDLGDASSGELGRQLRMLGLVLDSPDAESGMLLVAPF